MPHTVTVQKLLHLTRRAARGKRRRGEVALWLLDPVPRLTKLKNELDNRSYRPGTPQRFVIHEPKRRIISALPFRDRVAQHYLVDHTLPTLERWFAPQSYACRVGFGSHRALARAIALHRTHPWVLRIDIAKFFPSADHDVLSRLLLPRCPQHLRWLLKRILIAPGHVEATDFRFPGDTLFTPLERPRGLPVGNLTSQVWANALLTPVDHMLTSQLGLGHFVRYSDDSLIYAHDRQQLEDALLAIRARCDTLRLRLHPRKCGLHRTSERVGFLGFVLERREQGVRVRLRAENPRRFRRRMAEARQLLETGALEPEDMVARVRAWLAHAAHGHTRTLCRRELERLGNLRA